MMYASSALPLAALVSLVQGHAVILAAQGIAGSNTSIGFQVDTALARNCTSISPCQQDATIIRDAEISANLVNECGRTELTGNIDVGENTENALVAGTVTQVQAGTQLTVTIHQVNADGAGPYVCDLDTTSNAGIAFTNLTVTNNVPGSNGLSQAKFQDFNITVTMPTNLTCTGASTGNVCTVRCRNNAVAGPFGGCFAVQQVNSTAAANTATNIVSAGTMAGVAAQIAHNKQDLAAAVAANQNAGTAQALQEAANVNAMLGINVVTKAFPVETPAAAVAANNNNNNQAAAAAATTTTTTAAASATTTSGSKKKGGKKNKNGKRWVVGDSA